MPVNDRGQQLPGNAYSRQVYTPLQGAEVRTLLLAPGKSTKPIVCELDVAKDPRAHQYEAVSYVWGETTSLRKISCNELEFQITDSLYQALVHLRYPKSWRRLWVDQLCIDQSQHDELMSQVRHMGAIYSTAARVVIWLGDEDKKMKGAWDVLKETSISASLVRSDYLDSSPASSPIRRTSVSRSPSSWSLQRITSFSSSTDSLASLSSSTSSIRKRSKRESRLESNLNKVLLIFQHPWFCRTWTFQEICLAEAAIICCGEVEVAWSDLAAWYFHYAAKPGSSKLLYDSVGSFEHILNVRSEIDKQQQDNSHGITLSELLMLTRQRKSLKAEDIIYALLGLHSGFSAYLKSITAQEGWLPVPELFLAAFRYCLDVEHDLSVLSAAGLYQANHRYPQWPSWLPDWREQMPLRPLTLGASAGNQASLRASGSTTAVYKLRDHEDNQFGFTAQGYRIGIAAVKTGSWPNTFLIPGPPAQAILDEGVPSKWASPLSSLLDRSNLPVTDADADRDTADYAVQTYERATRDHELCEPIRVTAAVENGDWVCVLLGAPVLYVMRPHASPSKSEAEADAEAVEAAEMREQSDRVPVLSCRFVGECAVGGLMDGALMRLLTSADPVTFDLI